MIPHLRESSGEAPNSGEAGLRPFSWPVCWWFSESRPCVGCGLSALVSLDLLVCPGPGANLAFDRCPRGSGENLLLPLAPIGFIMVPASFSSSWTNWAFPNAGYRFAARASSLRFRLCSFAFKHFPPHPSPLVYPPYYPALDPGKGRLYQGGGLMMTDIPWAVSWYGMAVPACGCLYGINTAEGSFLQERFL